MSKIQTKLWIKVDHLSENIWVVLKKQNVREKPKTRSSYKCRICNKVGHNAAFYKGATGNK